MGQASTNQRDRLMMATERLNQSTDRIKESRRSMLETEELGVSILQDLHQQRQSLLHAHKTVRVLHIFYLVFLLLKASWLGECRSEETAAIKPKISLSLFRTFYSRHKEKCFYY